MDDERSHFCLYCGYDLHGTAPGGNCPECGRQFVPTSRLIDADPVWLRRVISASNGIGALMIVPVCLIQATSALGRPGPWWATLPMIIGCMVCAVWHLRAASILSGEVWLEAASETSLRRRSLLLLFSFLTVLSIILIGVGGIAKQNSLLTVGLVLSLAMAPCVELDLRFIAAIARRLPDHEIAERAESQARPMAIGIAIVLLLFAAVVTFGRALNSMWSISLFAPLIPLMFWNAKVTQRFAIRMKDLSATLKARKRTTT
jgi:hypothetical protein